jgi:hypothetical protein
MFWGLGALLCILNEARRSGTASDEVLKFLPAVAYMHPEVITAI